MNLLNAACTGPLVAHSTCHGQQGNAGGNSPDDAHLLADGTFLTADIRNCRVLIIDPKDSKIVTQWGTPGQCKHNPPKELAFPNGATPLDNGDILIVDDLNDRVIVVDRQTKKIIWQYGEKGKKGHAPGLLNYPDGVDIDVYRDWKSVRAK